MSSQYFKAAWWAAGNTVHTHIWWWSPFCVPLLCYSAYMVWPSGPCCIVKIPGSRVCKQLPLSLSNCTHLCGPTLTERCSKIFSGKRDLLHFKCFRLACFLFSPIIEVKYPPQLVFPQQPPAMKLFILSRQGAPSNMFGAFLCCVKEVSF